MLWSGIVGAIEITFNPVQRGRQGKVMKFLSAVCVGLKDMVPVFIDETGFLFKTFAFGDLLRCNLRCSLNVLNSTPRFAPRLRLASHPNAKVLISLVRLTRPREKSYKKQKIRAAKSRLFSIFVILLADVMKKGAEMVRNFKAAEFGVAAVTDGHAWDAAVQEPVQGGHDR